MFLNLFHHSKLAAMPPKLQSDDGRHIVIRPLAYCAEDDIAEYAAAKRFPIMPCNLCGSQETLQRKAIKAMLAEWERKHPGRIENTFRALTDVRPSQLADRQLFDFVALGARGERSDAHAWLAGEASEESDRPARAAAVAAASGLDILEA
jgi:tRNA 2-thiocytidine biosynthesis protein TtcA